MSTDTSDSDTEHRDSDAATTVVGADAAPVSLSHHVSEWAKNITPPDLWRNGRPPLKRSWTWARHGQHMPNDDTARMGTQIGAWITLPLRAVCLYLDWLLERPSRAVFAAVLITSVVLAVWG